MKKILFAGLILLLPLMVRAEYHVDKDSDNEIKFISEAPIEEFEGVTSDIDGYLTADNLSSLDGAEVYFEVDLNTIDTGIGLRNRHMREDYLETEKWRYTHFKGTVISVKKQGDEYIAKAKGKMFIHGEKMDKTITATVKPSSGDNLNIHSEFMVKLSDYKIDIPKVMFMKLSEEISLVIDFDVKKVK